MNSGLEDLEIEIKYEVKKHYDLGERILGQEFLLNGTGGEKNSFLDFDNRLGEIKTRLRIREYCNEVIGTIKRNGKISQEGVKSIPEKNIGFKDTLENTIGFFRWFGAEETKYYEKENRDTYLGEGGYVICVDTILDRGRLRYFVEVEGPKNKGVIRCVEKIGLLEKKFEARVVRESYYEMFAKKRK